jgi:peptidoglycan/xylan/chitin deacetylase (PgdA/CDA1 family)
MRNRRWLIVALALMMVGSVGTAAGARPLPREDGAFARLWAQTDGVRPPDQGWIWGPQGWWQTAEPYAESPDGLRWVRYYDKARMEVTSPRADSRSDWYVTNGLLVRELVSGEIQRGNAARIAACPAAPCGSPQAIAGDSDPASRSPGYRDFAGLLAHEGGSRVGQPVDQWLLRDAAGPSVAGDPELAARYPQTAGFAYDEVTGHTVPLVLWDFIASRLLEPLYLFGHPISPAYWTRALVGGVEQDVLVQLFERRTLTYTPANPAGWQIEMGNVGQHYYAWRYPSAGAMPWQLAAAYAVPILTYHYISDNPDPSDTLRTLLSVTPRDFAAQLEYLAANGYTALSLDELLAAQTGAAPLPARPVLLTFDDGYVDFYTQAAPLLRQYGMKATAYIPSDLIGAPGYMSWDQLRELAGSPLITIGGHSRTHPPLDTLGWEAQRSEIVDSKAILESQLGIPVAHFCFPYGRYNATTLDLVALAGYRSATTTRTAIADQAAAPLVLPRVAISGGDGLAGFVAKLTAVGP